jgi:hypothetical protein
MSIVFFINELFLMIRASNLLCKILIKTSLNLLFLKIFLFLYDLKQEKNKFLDNLLLNEN